MFRSIESSFFFLKQDVIYTLVSKIKKITKILELLICNAIVFKANQYSPY